MKALIRPLIIFTGIVVTWLALPSHLYALPDYSPYSKRDTATLCTNSGGKPIIRLFNKTNCSGCALVTDAFETATDPYVAQGTIDRRIWMQDTMTIPEEEMAICYDFTSGACPNPTAILGCQYYYTVAPGDLNPFKEATADIIDYQLGSPPPPVNSPTPTRALTPTRTPTPGVKKGDFDIDKDVDILDTLTLLKPFGSTNCTYNLTGTGCLINILDLRLQMTSFGR